MIVRAIDRPSATLLIGRTYAPPGVRGAFGRIDVLQLTSAELRESFGIRLAELDVETPFELVAALTRFRGERTAAEIRNNRLVRLIDRRPDLLPSFVGYQDVPGLGFLPFMSDGPPGKWSLFFEDDGRMTLVERPEGELVVTTEPELVTPARPAAEPVSASFLLSAVRRRMAPAANEERRVIRIGADGRQPNRG